MEGIIIGPKDQCPMPKEFITSEIRDHGFPSLSSL
jgi:hypothetical protein